MTNHVEPVTPADVVPTVPLAAARRSARGAGGRVRWLVALVVAALVLGLAGGATLLLTASAGDAAVLAWVPADSTMYAEMRLDLPGSQRTEVPKLLAAFPGFADQSAFPAKLGEALDRLIKSASDGKHDYQTEIAPWFGGEVAVAGGPIAAPAANATPADMAAKARVLLLASVTDGAKATAWLGSVLTATGATTSTESYGGVTLTIIHVPAPSGSAATPAMPDGAFAVLDKVLVAGDTASVRAAVDTRGSRGLGTVPAFRAAAAAVAGDRVAFAWADTKALLEPATAAASGAVKDTMLTALLGLVRDGAPAWTAGAIRAVDGNLVIDTAAPKTASATQDSAAGADTAQLAKLVPADTVLLLGARSPGAALADLRARLAGDPALAPAVAQVDQALGVVGGFDAATGWIGDTGIAVTNTDGKLMGGLVIVPADAAGAKRILTQLRSIAQIAGAAANVIPTFDDTPYGDAVVTIVDIPNAGNLLKLLPGAIDTACPACRLAAPADIHITFAYATTPQVVVIGSDARFVKAVLDARSGPSLATQPRFKDLQALAGASRGGIAWVDIAAVRDIVVTALPSSARASYDADVTPYLAPVDALVAARSTDGNLVRSTIILSIKP